MAHENILTRKYFNMKISRITVISVVFTLLAVATVLAYTNRSLAALLLLLLCLPEAAKFYVVVSQDVVIVAQMLYLKCVHVLVETSIYVACYSHRGISMYVYLL